jgi:hypothetical protein
MTRPRLLTLVVLGIAVASTRCEAKTTGIHVTAEVVQQTFSGDPTSLQLGDRRLNNVDLFDESRTTVGTGAGCCPMVSIPRLDTREECLLTAEFPEGQIMCGGVAPLAEIGAVARFGMLGGTDAFRHACGEAPLVVTTSGSIDVTFDLDQPVWP